MKINRILLLGRRKNYDLPEFQDGLNIIHGSTDTGKSMILRLISYALGKSRMSKVAPEVDEACNYIVLELTINNAFITIKRNIHRESDPIEIFFDKLENIKRPADELYHIRGTQKFKPFTEFLMKRLNVPELKVPYAPNDPNAGYNSVSIKDVINLIYLNDEEIGSQDFLGRSNPSKHIKYIESLKVLLKLEDPRLQELQHTRNIKNKQRNDLQSYIKEVNKFLIENNLFNSLDIQDSLTKTISKVKELEEGLKDLNRNIQGKRGLSNDLNNEILSKKETISSLREDINITKIKISEFKELLKRYALSYNDKETFLKLEESLNLEKSQHCPVCNNLVNLEENFNREYLIAESVDLKNKIEDLQEVIKENDKLLISMENQVSKEEKELTDLEERNSLEFESYLSPLLKSRDDALIEVGRQKELLNYFEEKKKIIDEYHLKQQTFEKLEKEINEIDRKLNELRKNLKGKAEAVEELSKYFREFIKYIGQKGAEDPKINSDFVPIIQIGDREISYYQIPGTAKKVVIAVAYYTALLEYRLKNDTYLPNVLMIDSPSTGRGTNPQDPPEKVDIEVYNKMFEYWKKLIQNTKNKAQIIVVDNARPPEIATKNILVTFDKLGTGGVRKGLIDDLK